MPVAPIQQGKSYSDMVNEQIGLIQQQRSANLNQRLAQEEKNREFRQEQQQNIYDFDVSGLPQAYIEKISELQGQMASWLDPKSDVHYEDSQQLTRDVAKLNNIYMSGKRLAAQGQPAMKGYEDGMLGKTKTPGVTSIATEETYKNRRAAYDQGGFGGMKLVGGPGEVGLFGVPMVEGENGMWSAPEEGEQVDILSYQIDPFSLFRQEQIRDFINVEQKYVDEKDPDMAVLRAESDFNSNPESVQAEFRVKLANEDESWLEKNDDGSFKKDTAELLELYKAEAKSGWDKFHSTELPPSLLGGSATQTEYGNAIKLTDPKTGKDRTVSLISGGERRTVTNVGFSGKGDDTKVFYIYTDPDNPNGYGEAIVPFDSLEGMSLINDTGSIGAIAKMVGMSVEDVENIDPVAASGDASTVNEGGEEGGDGGAQGTTNAVKGGEEEVVQQDASAPDTIGDYKTALNEMATPTGLGFGFMQSREQKLAAEIQNEPLATQIARIDEEIAALEESIENTPSRSRAQGAFQGKLDTLERLKALKGKQKGIDTPEAKTTRLDNIESRITDIDVELLDLQGRGTQKAKDRRKLEAEKMSLRGEMAQIDPDYYAATQLPSERPEVTAATGPAIQGQGAGIAYSKPQPPQDLNAFEVGDDADGSTKEQRENAFKEAVRMAEEAGHPYPEAVATQYALESGYGKKKAANYNYFGLKSSPAMIKRLADAGIEATAGDSVATQEVIDGKTKTIKDSFLSFKSPEDAFTAYLMFIDTTKKDGERRYGEALDESKTALDYLKGIRKAGYATATNYADSLNTVAKGFGIDLAEIERKPVGTASN